MKANGREARIRICPPAGIQSSIFSVELTRVSSGLDWCRDEIVTSTRSKRTAKPRTAATIGLRNVEKLVSTSFNQPVRYDPAVAIFASSFRSAPAVFHTSTLSAIIPLLPLTTERRQPNAGEDDSAHRGVLIEKAQSPCQLVYQILRHGVSFERAIQRDDCHTRFPDRQHNGRKLWSV